MRTIATFDIGTTAVKGALVLEDGRTVAQGSVELETLHAGDFHEQRPDDWWRAFCQLSRDMQKEYGKPVCAICMSGQMQDVIPVDEDLRPLRNAILYSDGRAGEEARDIQEAVGAQEILARTGNPFDGSISLPKMLWLKRNEPEIYARTRCFLISSKDYVAAKCTGAFASDRTSCSTAGCMNLQSGQWDETIVSAAGLRIDKLPRLCASHERVGAVTASAALKTGYAEGTPVYAGAGDAGATSLASGLSRPGQYNINLGTSGWVATLSESALRREGVFNLGAMPEGKIINIVPFLNGAGAHRWVSTLFSQDDSPDYARMDALLAQSVPGANGVMALPYLTGERFPVLDEKARGAFIGLSPDTRACDLSRAMLEGVAFSIRQGLEQLGTEPEEISLIGGGARVAIWREILCNVLGKPVTVFSNADTLPARAIAAAALIGESALAGYDAFVEGLKHEGAQTVQPDASLRALYDAQYLRYRKIYPALQGV